MNNKELIGQHVLVHPVLWDDPAEKNGEIGKITEADIADDLIRVKFEDQKYGFYGSDSLLVFRPSNDIYEQLKQNAGQLSAEQFKDLKNIARLLDYGKEPQLLKAMEMVRENPESLRGSMISLENKLRNAEVRQVGR